MNLPKVPARYSHFVFGIIQSGLTAAVAAAIASAPLLQEGTFSVHWLQSWLLSWVVMVPVVIAGAPFIRRLTARLTE